MTEVPLLGSKLEPPDPPPGLVERPRLGRVLDTGRHNPMTLVNAPPGWGKSVLLSWWTRTTDFRVGWFGIEDGDDPRFWSYLRAALVSTGGFAGHALPSPDEMCHEEFLPRLAAELAELREPVGIVLDDFHRIRDPRVLKGLEYLVQHAGRALRVVIATRGGPGPPLTRLRLAGAVTVLEAAELSFTLTETVELLAALGLELPDRYTRILLGRTEGWSAGLRLAAMSAGGHGDPLRFVDGLSGDHEAIAGYFTSEVLDGLDGAHLEVLLCGSVLERLTGSLADALTGRTDGERILAELWDVGAFLDPVGDRPSSYRCHRLFGEYLRRELARRAPRRVPNLHHRAAAWYAARGSSPDALRHALLSLNWRMATDLLADHWPDLVLSSSDRPLHTSDPTPPEEVLRDDPDLALACALNQQLLGDRRGTDRYLRLARDRIGAGDDRVTAIHLARSVAAGDVAATFSQASRLLAHHDDDDRTRSVALSALGTAHLATGDLHTAERALDDGLAAAERAGLERVWVACLSKLAVVRALLGELHLAEQAAQDSLGLARIPAACGYAQLALAITHHEWGEPGEVARYLDLADGTGDQVLAALISIVRLWLLQAGRSQAGANQVLREARHELTGWAVPTYIAHRFTAAEAALRTNFGDTGTAARLLADQVGTSGDSAPLAVALARTQLRNGDLDAAMRTAADAPNEELGGSLEAGLLEALAADRLGQDRHASTTLEKALQLADQERFRGVFIREGPAARRLLSAHLDSGTAYWPFVMDIIDCAAERTDRPVAPLTERELTVLRYLQSVLTTEEIAAELHVTVNTMKTHMRHIYRKLTASRRREAVRKAREAQLL
ncbi:LuxR C-terminal-related transcriptional regulator [Actinomadura madurae]|uniref:LuxR C-terminal-related transcriptional regulator n=1 Tax=Actinomadura madurae TaxID=1993 RepID=UPI0020266B15|nr:LuxR C-terminal-related transcriptional regulator [Actinomadura madurae]URM96406.1 LuxR C-terminal-related transcriptional regulator [Actinomadura madurae]